MTNWIDTLASTANAPLADPDTLARGFVAPVTDQGLIAVTGDDAATFLHSLLTNDITHLGANEARLAGFCTPKGRLLGSFLAWRATGEAGDTVYLQLARELQPALQKRLSMYVLRARAKLADATAAAGLEAALCIGGAAGLDALQGLGLPVPQAPMAATHGSHGSLIRLGDAFGAARYLWLTSAGQAGQALSAWAGKLVLAGNQAWALANIHAGLPQIVAATQEKFVPQMVNFDLLDGINFKKGCYPGQEIVARTKYLGTVKRRTVLARTGAAANPGDEVFSALDPDQPCGMVVNASPNGLGGTDMLVEMKLASLGDALVLGASTGPAVTLLPMPYPLDAADD